MDLGFDSADDAERAIPVVGALTPVEVRRDGAASIALTVPDGDRLLPASVRALDAAGISVASATGVPPTLDDVFLALTGRTLREAGEGTATEENEETDAAGPEAAAAASEKTGARR